MFHDIVFVNSDEQSYPVVKTVEVYDNRLVIKSLRIYDSKTQSLFKAFIVETLVYDQPLEEAKNQSFL